MEKLNSLVFKGWGSDKIDSVNNRDSKTAEVTKYAENNGNIVSNEKLLKNDKNDRRIQLDDIYQGWQSLTQSPINSIINRSKIALKNSISKSLSNSPVNMGAFSFGKSKIVDMQGTSSECNTQDQTSQQRSEKETSVNLSNEKHIIKGQIEVSNNKNQNDSSNEKENTHNSKCENRKNDNLPTKVEPQTRPSHLSVDDTQVQNMSKATHSLDSTPVRVKSLSSAAFTNSLNKGLNGNMEKAQNDTHTDCSSSKAKELPLLSFFQKSTGLKPTKDKSCSMINLNEKQNLKILLDNADLGNIQAVSVEKLANARHKLVGDT